MAEDSRVAPGLKGPWGHADVLIQTMKPPQRGGELRLHPCIPPTALGKKAICPNLDMRVS